MSGTVRGVEVWLLHALVGGGLLLLLARGLLARTAQPARRQRLGEAGLGAALLLALLSLGPAWLAVPLPDPGPPAPPPPAAAEAAAGEEAGPVAEAPAPAAAADGPVT